MKVKRKRKEGYKKSKEVQGKKANGEERERTVVLE